MLNMLDDIRPPKQKVTTSNSDNNEIIDNILPEVSEKIESAPESMPVLGEEPYAANDQKMELSINKPKKHWLGALTPLGLRTRILMAAALVLVTLGCIGSYVTLKKAAYYKEPIIAKPTYEKPVPPKPSIEASRLTGLPVAPEVNLRPVLGVMVENSPDARPQSGIKEAGLVFEAIAEGGITRFALMYQDTTAERIGPIRSVRPYYLDWYAPFQAGVAHVGGSGDALAQLRGDPSLRDLDQFSNSGAYSRIKERFAPHNVYSSTPRLVDLMKSKGYTSSEFTSIARSEKEAPLEIPTASVIDLGISGPLYNVHYEYDKAANTYKRSEGGRPHTDEPSGAQLTPKIVVALVIPYGIAPNRVNSFYNTSGQGKVYVFQNGTAIQGTWQKTDRKSQYVFKRDDGTPLELSTGQTWFTAVSDAGKVTYR